MQRKIQGLKACVVDQTEDPSAESPDFYRSSVALYMTYPPHSRHLPTRCCRSRAADGSLACRHAAWGKAGMRSNASFSPGAHCHTHSFQWIIECLDDGTGRLLGQSSGKCVQSLRSVCSGGARNCAVCKGVNSRGAPVLPPPACSRAEVRAFCEHA